MAIVHLLGEDPRVEQWAHLIRESRKLGRAMLSAAGDGDPEAIAFYRYLDEHPELDDELTLGPATNGQLVITQAALDVYNRVLAAQAIVATEEAIEDRLATEELVTVYETWLLFTGENRPDKKTFRRWLEELTPIEVKPKLRYRKCDAIRLCLRRNGSLRLKRDKQGH